MESLNFLTEESVRELVREHPTPFFVYDEQTLRKRAQEVLAFPNAFGLTGRYAMKALPNTAVSDDWRKNASRRCLHSLVWW